MNKTYMLVIILLLVTIPGLYQGIEKGYLIGEWGFMFWIGFWGLFILAAYNDEKRDSNEVHKK